MDQSSDKELILKYLDGDNKSLNILIRNYLKPIYNFVYVYVSSKQEAEDITQEVFLKVWKNIKKFKKDKNFKTWIYKIAKNTSIDFLKKKKNILFSDIDNNKENKDDLQFIETIADDEYLPDEIYSKKELEINIQNILDDIPIKYKEIMELYYINEFNFREISEIINEPLNTVKSKHRRGLIILKNKIEKI